MDLTLTQARSRRGATAGGAAEGGCGVAGPGEARPALGGWVSAVVSRRSRTADRPEAPQSLRAAVVEDCRDRRPDLVVRQLSAPNPVVLSQITVGMAWP